jgi:hypothetical protein
MSKRALGVVAASAAIIAVGVVLLVSNDGGKSVRGSEINLDKLHGHVVLLSFLNTRAERGNDPSRAQVVFLRSMQTQHSRFGLRVIIVDAAEVAGMRKPSRNELINFGYDAHLDPAIAVLPDNGSAAKRFAVHTTPTTFLIDEEGALRKRWNGFAGAAELDLAIKQLEGRSATG